MDLKDNVKILFTSTAYNFEADNRLLIPFTRGEKIGFMDRQHNVVIKPKFDRYFGECFTSEDFIRVSVKSKDGFTHQEGLIDSTGFEIVPPIYSSVNISSDSRLVTLKRSDGEYGVVNLNQGICVDFGIYRFIGPFHNGIARVKIAPSRWSIINENGAMLLPLEYAEIEDFSDGNYLIIKISNREKTGFAIISYDANNIPSVSMHSLIVSSDEVLIWASDKIIDFLSEKPLDETQERISDKDESILHYVMKQEVPSYTGGGGFFKFKIKGVYGIVRGLNYFGKDVFVILPHKMRNLTQNIPSSERLLKRMISRYVLGM